MIFFISVKQGDALSSHIFNRISDEIFRKIDWKNTGIKVNGVLHNLQFADDVILIDQSLNNLEKIIKDIIEKGKL